MVLPYTTETEPNVNERPKKTPLTHNLKNAVTADIYRLSDEDESSVVKCLRRTNSDDTPSEWRASLEPHHWNFWQREHLVYTSELACLLSGSQVRLPELLSARESPDGFDLVLEDVDGRSGADLSLDDYVALAEAWGTVQSRLDYLLEEPWLSRRFIRDYALSKPVNYELLTDGKAWSAPLIADAWPPSLQEGLRFMYGHREALGRLLDEAPRVASHLDFWPNNVLIDAQEQFVLIDWSFFGVGAVGEDIGNFIPDAVFDDFAEAQDLAMISQRMIEGYCNGLVAGARTNQIERLQHLSLADITRWIQASAVKYVWLGPLLLERAQLPEQQRYGGARLKAEEAHRQYEQRGATLLFLCDWAERALKGG